MNFTVLLGIGILLVLTIIGLLILLRRNSFNSENSKRIYIVIGALQAVHIMLYLTGLLDKIAQVKRTSQSLCKAPVWCRIEAPHRRNYK